MYMAPSTGSLKRNEIPGSHGVRDSSPQVTLGYLLLNLSRLFTRIPLGIGKTSLNRLCIL